MLNIIRFIKNKEKYNCLDEKFKTIGITVSGFEYLKPSVWQDIYDTLCDLYERYNFIPSGYLIKIKALNTYDYLKEISYIEDEYLKMKSNTIASTMFIQDKDWINRFFPNKTQIVLNVKLIKHIKKYLTPIEIPQNYIKFLIAHEFGHIIDFYLSGIEEKLYFGNDSIDNITYKNFIEHLCFSETIIKRAIFVMYHTEDLNVIKKEVGDLNQYNEGEIFAELIALSYNHVDKPFIRFFYNHFCSYIKGR